jgi:hypothetical protein
MRERWIHAALVGLCSSGISRRGQEGRECLAYPYENVPCPARVGRCVSIGILGWAEGGGRGSDVPGAARPPPSPEVTSTVVMPAMEAMLMTRPGFSGVASLSSRGSRPTVM